MHNHFFPAIHLLPVSVQYKRKCYLIDNMDSYDTYIKHHYELISWNHLFMKNIYNGIVYRNVSKMTYVITNIR